MQPGLRVHVADEVVHARERGVVLVDDDLHAVVEQGQVGVGDDAGDLDDHVVLDIEPGHLEIDPRRSAVVRRARSGGHCRLHATGCDRR